MANWDLSEWLCTVFDNGDPAQAECLDLLSTAGFNVPHMKDVGPSQLEKGRPYSTTNAYSMPMQAFLALSMNDLKEIGIEPFAKRKKLHMAIQGDPVNYF